MAGGGGAVGPDGLVLRIVFLPMITESQLEEHF